MPNPSVPEDEFMELIRTYGPAETARRINTDVRNVYKRRERLELKTEQRIGRVLSADRPEHPQRAQYTLDNGVVLVASDAHYWPNYISTAHRALVEACKRLKPKIVVMNGDVMDGAMISRHPPITWEQRPSVIQELEACKERLDEIRCAAKNAKFVWTLGNHDARFETRLATVAPEYAKVHGVHLQDHFPEWRPCWSVWINDDVVIKHRIKGGIHATHNNTLWAGKTTVTGHLHSLKVTPFSDYNGTRWGVDSGTLADPYGPQFNAYTEDNPLNWRSGFVGLTFINGELLDPELVRVVREGEVCFRGRKWRV